MRKEKYQFFCLNLIFQFYDKKLSSQINQFELKIEMRNVVYEPVPNYVPSDCDVVFFGPGGVKCLDKQRSIALIKQMRKNCPCRKGKNRCNNRHVKKLDINHWLDAHIRISKKFPFKVKYVCQNCSIGYRHFHPTFESRRTSVGKFCTSKNTSLQAGKFTLIKIIFVKPVCSFCAFIFAETIEKVPNSVPSDCDMVIISTKSTQFVSKKDSFQFKKAIWERCPCQQSQANCLQTINLFLSIHRWFDNKFHSKFNQDWPYTQVKYVCDGCSIEYRHFHSSYLQRYLRSRMSDNKNRQMFKPQLKRMEGK